MSFTLIRRIGPAYVWRDSRGHEWITLFDLRTQPATKGTP